MKKVITFTLLLTSILINYSKAQTKSCCSMNATSEFAMLGSNADFQKMHASPDPINFTPTKGVEITFPTTDGTDGRAYFVKTEIKSKKFLLVFHEWWGLNDHIRNEAERFSTELYSSDVNVIAIDLYDGMVATNADEAGKLMQAVKTERAIAIIKGVLNYIGTDAEIQTIGWCFGGGWSLQAAIEAGTNLKGCVIYYGMPEKDSKRIQNLSGPVLGIFASKDGWINKPVVEEFEKQMKAANKKIEVKWYDADHAFANPSNPSKYDKAAADDANKLSLNFIKKNFVY